MVFEVINNPTLIARAGFSNAQFKKLDGLYLQAAAEKLLNYRTVECDFDEGLASYTYYVSDKHTPFIQFVLRKVGPGSMMYEIYKQDKGRIFKSGVFDRAFDQLKANFERLRQEP